MHKFSVQSRPLRGVARENLVPNNEPNAAETRQLGFVEPANDQVEIQPMMGDGDDGISTTSGPPDPPPDPDPDQR